jgi:hypothetical protein
MAWSYWWMLLFAGFASAQNVDKAARMGPALLAHPHAGVPVSFDQTEERSPRENSGSTDKVVVRSKVFRDSSGRIRIEAGTFSLLIDPIDGSRVALLSHAQTAYRTPWPRSTEAQFGIGIGINIAVGSSSREMTATAQDLGERWIEGIKFTGTRTVLSVKGEPQPTKTFEEWYSIELHLIGLALASSPQETNTARIENIRREEPNTDLFTIPPDYEILELHEPQP